MLWNLEKKLNSEYWLWDWCKKNVASLQSYVCWVVGVVAELQFLKNYSNADIDFIAP